MDLNDLPAAILEHIVSFLGTKEAVRTSILSREWQYIWTSIPNLEFDEAESSSSRKVFMNFVGRALLLHNNSCDISKFSISCDVLDDDDASLINTWVSAVLRRKVEHLSVKLNLISNSSDESSFVLPREVFTCGTLKMLKIRMFSNLRFPPNIALASLRKLFLTNVIFEDNLSTKQLLSLPSIEELKLSKCDWSNLSVVHIGAPKLQNLIIAEATDGHCLCHMKIFASSLTHFTLTCQFTNVYSLTLIDASSSLVVANISVFNWGNASRLAPYCFYKLLRELSAVQNLILTGADQLINRSAAAIIPNLRTFINLTNLKFRGGVIYVDSKAFLSIVASCPLLQSLEFSEVGIISSSCQSDNRPYFPPSLRSIEIWTFSGNTEELEAVKMFLVNAMSLDRIYIHCSSLIMKGSDEETHVNEQLDQLFGLYSKTCELLLYSKIEE